MGPNRGVKKANKNDIYTASTVLAVANLAELLWINLIHIFGLLYESRRIVILTRRAKVVFQAKLIRIGPNY